MGYEANDIQFSDDALGLGRALRLTANDGRDISFSQDSDNADITIVTYSPGEYDPINRYVITTDFEVDALGALIRAPLYFVNADAGDIIITLPLTASNKNKYRFIRIDSSAHTVTFVGKLGTERFGGDGAPTSLYMLQGEDFDFVTDYLDWFI